MTKNAPLKLFVFACAAIFVGGCMTTNDVYGGEGFGIAAGNFGKTEIEQVRISGVGDDKRQFDASAGLRPFLGDRLSFARASTLQDNRQRIPEKVSVIWREMPPAGQPSYTGPQRGPFVIDIRSRIPPEVLRKVRSRGFAIEIGVDINDGPINMNWQLVDYQTEKPNGQKTVVRQGGDSFK